VRARAVPVIDAEVIPVEAERGMFLPIRPLGRASGKG
jgi:hypothetical protein